MSAPGDRKFQSIHHPKPRFPNFGLDVVMWLIVALSVYVGVRLGG